MLLSATTHIRRQRGRVAWPPYSLAYASLHDAQALLRVLGSASHRPPARALLQSPALSAFAARAAWPARFAYFTGSSCAFRANGLV
jgi:hypothetical protein